MHPNETATVSNSRSERSEHCTFPRLLRRRSASFAKLGAVAHFEATHTLTTHTLGKQMTLLGFSAAEEHAMPCLTLLRPTADKLKSVWSLTRHRKDRFSCILWGIKADIYVDIGRSPFDQSQAS